MKRKAIKKTVKIDINKVESLWGAFMNYRKLTEDEAIRRCRPNIRLH